MLDEKISGKHKEKFQVSELREWCDDAARVVRCDSRFVPLQRANMQTENTTFELENKLSHILLLIFTEIKILPTFPTL